VANCQLVAEICYNYMTRGDVTFNFLPIVNMPADELTKPQPAAAFISFRRVTGVGAGLGTSGLGATPAPRPASTC